MENPNFKQQNSNELEQQQEAIRIVDKLMEGAHSVHEEMRKLYGEDFDFSEEALQIDKGVLKQSLKNSKETDRLNMEIERIDANIKRYLKTSEEDQPHTRMIFLKSCVNVAKTFKEMGIFDRLSQESQSLLNEVEARYNEGRLQSAINSSAYGNKKPNLRLVK
jgi:hypothetical protein